MSYLISNRTSLSITMSPHLLVNGISIYHGLRHGCWAKFHKTPWDKVCLVPHVRLTTHQKDSTGKVEFEGKSCRGTTTADGLWRLQFSHKTGELRSMPLFGQSLSDCEPIRIRLGVWLIPLPRLRRDGY